MAFNKKPCRDPECGCHLPTLTDPVQALEFLQGRMEFAGVGEAVARSYADDLANILSRYEISFKEKGCGGG